MTLIRKRYSDTYKIKRYSYIHAKIFILIHYSLLYRSLYLFKVKGIVNKKKVWLIRGGLRLAKKDI